MHDLNQSKDPFHILPYHQEKKDTQKFEYVLVVMFSDNFKLDKILEIDWNLFLKHKRWHGTMKAWNLSITKALLSEAEIVYQR